MKRIIELSRYGMSLMIRDGCLQIMENGDFREGIPLREISAVMIVNPAVSLTGYVLAELAEQHIPLICCSERLVPVAFACCNGSEALQAAFLTASRPLKKRLWQALIRSKIFAQAVLLKQVKNSDRLFPLIKRVQSGDPKNVEAHAAAEYWRELDLMAKRDRKAADENLLLNYGYTVLFGAVARECALAGFYHNTGLKHHHRNNPYRLASDLMEPFRACVDRIIVQMRERMPKDGKLSAEQKKTIVKGLYRTKIRMDGKTLSLFYAIRKCVFSFRQAILNKDCNLFILPDWSGV